jgi:hypothetical protein
MEPVLYNINMKNVNLEGNKNMRELMLEKIEHFSHGSFSRLRKFELIMENLMSGNIFSEKHCILLVHVLSSFSSVM